MQEETKPIRGFERGQYKLETVAISDSLWEYDWSGWES